MWHTYAQKHVHSSTHGNKRWGIPFVQRWAKCAPLLDTNCKVTLAKAYTLLRCLCQTHVIPTEVHVSCALRQAMNVLTAEVF